MMAVEHKARVINRRQRRQDNRGLAQEAQAVELKQTDAPKEDETIGLSRKVRQSGPPCTAARRGAPYLSHPGPHAMRSSRSSSRRSRAMAKNRRSTCLNGSSTLGTLDRASRTSS